MGKKIRIFITNINLSTLCIIEGITPKYSVEISRSFQKSQAHKNLRVSLSSTSPFPPDHPNSLIILFKHLRSLILCVSCSQTDTPIPYDGTHDQSGILLKRLEKPVENWIVPKPNLLRNWMQIQHMVLVERNGWEIFWKC